MEGFSGDRLIRNLKAGQRPVSSDSQESGG